MIDKYAIFKLLSDYFKVSNTQTFLTGSVPSLYSTGIVNLLSERGTEIITPFPVPIHSLLQEISMAVMRTKENPSLPVPGVVKRIYRHSLSNIMLKIHPMDIIWKYIANDFYGT